MSEHEREEIREALRGLCRFQADPRGPLLRRGKELGLPVVEMAEILWITPRHVQRLMRGSGLEASDGD